MTALFHSQHRLAGLPRLESVVPVIEVPKFGISHAGLHQLEYVVTAIEVAKFGTTQTPLR